MSGDNARVKSAWLMAESGGFAVIPDASGAAAIFIPAELDEGQFIKNQQKLIPRNVATGRNKELPAKVATNAASFGCRPYATGPVTSVSTATNPPATKTWIDYLLEAVLGTAISHNAGVVGSSPSTTTLPSTTSLVVGELVALLGASTNGGRVQWARVGSPASTPYPISPTLQVVSGVGDTLYASRTYRPQVGTNANSLIGYTLSVVTDIDGTQYVMPGARPSKLSLKAQAGMPVLWDVELMGDSRVQQAFASLPAAPTTDPEPMILRLCSVNLGGTLIDCASIEIDFGIQIAEVKGGQGMNGRSGWRVVTTKPRIKIDPLNLTSYETTFAAGTLQELLVQFGDGALTGGHVNSMAFHAEQAQIIEVPNEANDSGIIRKSLVLAPVDGGATAANAFYWQLGIV